MRLFLNPVDWKAVEPGLVAAKKAKIPVIVIDSQVYRNDLVAMTIVSDNYKAGDFMCQGNDEAKRSGEYHLVNT